MTTRATLLRRRQAERWAATIRAIDAGHDPRGLMTDQERGQLRSVCHALLATHGQPCVEAHH
jgi:hypothetical protein